MISLPIWLPVLLLLALLVRVRLGAPVFFTQERPGLGGKIFRLVKFRSMTQQRDSSGKLLPDHQRMPPFGRMLRATSLDELPELWNVLRGEMSLVGPRPLLPAYLARYDFQQARRQLLPPGITGWAQINGRNAIDWNQKFTYDLQYIESQSLLSDLKILLLTFIRIFQSEGIDHGQQLTMPEFTGDGKTRIFVYGTLRPGASAYKEFCQGRISESFPAKIRGNVIQLPAGYPGLLHGNNWIEGDVLIFNDDTLLSQMDQWEDYHPNRPTAQNLYNRQTTTIYTPSGDWLGFAQVYYYNPNKVSNSP